MAKATWGPDPSGPWLDTTIGALLRDRATATPQRTALYWERGDPANPTLTSLAYGELLAAATDAAHRLLAIAAPGEHVAIWSPNSVDWVLVEYGAALAGIVLVPVNPNLTDGEATDLLARSDSVAVLTVAEHRGSPLLARATASARDADRLPRLRDVVDLATWRDGDVTPGPLPDVAPGDTFLLQFTSGTTGRPKGAVLSHRATLNATNLLMGAIDPIDREVFSDSLPYHHLGGSLIALVGAACIGAAVTMFPRFDLEAVMRVSAQIDTTSLHLVPTMAIDLLARPDLDELHLPHLRSIMTGGALGTPGLIRRLEEVFHVPVLNAYGQTESTGACATRPGDDPEARATTIGRVLPQREIRITRVPERDVVEIGEIGELEMRSRMVMDGYYRDPAGTLEVLDADGWLRTGDLASMDARGYVTLHGRSRDVIVRGGENVYPKEIELVIAEHPGVEDVAVFGAHHERWGEDVAAAVRVAPGVQLDLDELDAMVRGRLASFKCPAHYYVLDEFPLVGPGKVDKRELRRRLGGAPS